MSFWEVDRLREACGGRFVARGDRAVMGVGIDSRSIGEGQAFVAIAGERFDGHDYLEQAVEGGASMLIVSDEGKGRDAVAGLGDVGPAVVVVDDTLAALQRMAVVYRKTLSARVIGITGSVGKTTTKQIAHAVLGVKLTGTAAVRSFNNHIGVPLTILATRPTDKYVIVEVGTNARGEVASLAKIAEPDVAVITAIGHAHVEQLGSVADIAAEKGALVRHLREGGLAIVRGEASLLDEQLKVAAQVVRFGKAERCDLRLTGYEAAGDGCRFRLNDRVDFELPLLGEHNAINALAAIAIGRSMKLSDDEIAAGMKRTEAASMRLNVRRVGPVRLINDAYNANPESMGAALRVLADMAASGRRVAVLGDMLELGSASEMLHRELAVRISEAGVGAAVLIGPGCAATAAELRRRGGVGLVQAEAELDDDAARRVASMVEPGDVVLVKASRGMRLERCAEAIARRFSGGGSATNEGQG